MKLVSMALTEEEAKEYAGGAVPAPGDAPKFPWGLCIELNDEAITKLGITELPKIGSMLTLMAHVQVVSIGKSQQIDNDEESRASLQITEMALAAPEASDPAETLYKS